MIRNITRTAAVLFAALAIPAAAVAAAPLAASAATPVVAKAPAAVSQAVTPAVSQAVAQAPLAQCPFIFLHRFTTYSPGCGNVTAKRLCFVGNEGNFLVIPHYAANGCIYRVWLYSGQNQTGSALCISPRSATGFLAVVRVSYRIVNNKHNC